MPSTTKSIYRLFITNTDTKAYLEPYWTLKMEFFAKIVKDF